MAQTTATIENVTQWTDVDHRMMSRALELAARGKGLVSPGPLVGCVIATPTGEILGEGFYVFDEVKHAETYALEQAGARAKGATAYVSLEPHAHHGRTPPCTDALINAGVVRVVAPIEDPNPKVSGQGFGHLRAANVQVDAGLLAVEAEKLNEKYIHFMRTGRPFVHLKLAASLDGKIATRTGDSRWISGPESRAQAHQLRHEYDAILVGAGTVAADDPLLTDRSGEKRRLPLVRVVLDDTLALSENAKLVETASETPTIVFASSTADEAKCDALRRRGVVVCTETNSRDLESVLEGLGKRGVTSVVVEGGASVAANLLEQGLVNKVSFFIAPLLIGGREAPSAITGLGAARLANALKVEDVKFVQRGSDIEITGYPKKSEA